MDEVDSIEYLYFNGPKTVLHDFCANCHLEHPVDDLLRCVYPRCDNTVCVDCGDLYPDVRGSVELESGAILPFGRCDKCAADEGLLSKRDKLEFRSDNIQPGLFAIK